MSVVPTNQLGLRITLLVAAALKSLNEGELAYSCLRGVFSVLKEKTRSAGNRDFEIPSFKASTIAVYRMKSNGCKSATRLTFSLDFGANERIGLCPS